MDAISIHAPRGGSDTNPAIRQRRNGNFNPRSPWGERPHADGALPQTLPISIHAPRGGSDSVNVVIFDGHLDFNPRSPWGERHQYFDSQKRTFGFQSTLPVGGATANRALMESPPIFQSTLPVGGATLLFRFVVNLLAVFQSTLPVGGATRRRRWSSCPAHDFNPRSPWGERRKPFLTQTKAISISIHAPRGGSDHHHQQQHTG